MSQPDISACPEMCQSTPLNASLHLSLDLPIMVESCFYQPAKKKLAPAGEVDGRRKPIAKASLMPLGGCHQLRSWGPLVVFTYSHASLLDLLEHLGSPVALLSILLRIHTSRGAGGSLTSLLVQPVSTSLASRLLSSPPSQEVGGACVPLATPPLAERKKVRLTIGNQWAHNKIYNLVGHLRGRRNSDRHVLLGSHHDSSQGGGASAIMTQLIATVMEQTKRGWAPDRTTVFCSWGGSALGNIGSFQWGQEHRVVLQSSAVSYVSLNSPVRGTERLRATASPALLQLTSDIQRRQLLSCMRGGNCPGPNVSSLQLPGDVSFFANQLAVPTVEFAFEQSKDEETTNYLSEAQFAIEPPEALDPLYKFHETIAKMTAEAIFRLVSDPVLPFYPLDIALDVQKKLKAISALPPALLSQASSLRDRAAFLQSETMRPANDPKEREPAHVRMLNDVLRDLEKSFVVPRAPPGVYRNLLYSLPGKTLQFSTLRFPQEDAGAAEGIERSAAREVPPLRGAYDNQSLSLILAAVRSAEKLVCFGLGLFDDNNTGDRK
ncbi:Inactive N-acetylated-alpha-linked acidic dipeptidase-like protein 2 [Merluccius polli]|uniref:Inactive N-acetylated-alpha-linked acidic dipeptidase-like protein 2 n=1 Tax=Merluccius polli TaxID=89951 RepID=A0AA47MQ74_MERPO|nr:Inactive N-acetylated-alpha-linked acidic dipeptidase-like protein 2 [Merluccius polli]